MSKDNGGPASDRELLEMAAKAAGVIPTGYGRNGVATGKNGACLIGWWNPLTDDGDALRLAVRLDLHVRNSFSDGLYVSAGVENKEYDSDLDRRETIWIADEGIESGDDLYAATRRAIVRAAAAIWSAM